MAERVVVVHSLDDARAAVAAAGELGVAVTLASAPGAGGYGGAPWFRELVALAAEDFPGVQVHALLDCADKPGYVLGALRLGMKHVRFTGSKSTVATLRGLAAAYGAQIVTGRVRALDLLDEADPAAACRAWLARP